MYCQNCGAKTDLKHHKHLARVNKNAKCQNCGQHFFPFYVSNPVPPIPKSPAEDEPANQEEPNEPPGT